MRRFPILLVATMLVLIVPSAARATHSLDVTTAPTAFLLSPTKVHVSGTLTCVGSAESGSVVSCSSSPRGHHVDRGRLDAILVFRRRASVLGGRRDRERVLDVQLRNVELRHLREHGVLRRRGGLSERRDRRHAADQASTHLLRGDCDDPGTEPGRPDRGHFRGRCDHRTRGSDIVFAGEGDDLVCGNGGSDVIDGGGDDDRMSGAFGPDFITGVDGDDQIRGGVGNDVLNFGDEEDGDDVVSGGGGDDDLHAGVGLDRLSATTGTTPSGRVRWMLRWSTCSRGGAGVDSCSPGAEDQVRGCENL